MSRAYFSEALTAEEASQFLEQFSVLHLASCTTIIIKPVEPPQYPGKRQIILHPMSDTAKKSLKSMFEKGILHHLGWSDKFSSPD